MTVAAMEAPYRVVVSGSDLPPDYLVLGKAAGENFPVASKLLPAEVRSDLMALYGWARLVDQLGDDYPGNRLAALDEVEGQLRTALGPGQLPQGGTQLPQGGTRPPQGKEIHPLVARMAETVRRLALPTQPLYDLVEANRQDQAVSQYESFQELVGYCRLSANPVGHMVLAIFGYATPDRLAWSDSICTGLQLVEHCQDVAEDAIAGRVYLPMQDLARFGVPVEELVPPPTGYVNRRRAGAPGGASYESRALMAFEVARARRWLDDGAPLVASLSGRLRVAVASFIAGGHAALDALAALDYDIYADPSRPAPRRFAAHLMKALGGAYRTKRYSPARGASPAKGQSR